MVRKSYFKVPSVEKMLGGLKFTGAYSQRNLVKKLLDLNPTDEGMQIRTNILPIRFLRGASTGVEASRKAYKHGALIRLSQPESREEAIASYEIPLKIRERDFSALQEKKEENIEFIGYTWQPVQGNDRRWRVVLFPSVTDAVGIFAYSENITGGIDVKGYENARKAKTEGASIVCGIPSRTKKKQRYIEKLVHVPVIGTDERRAVIWSLRADREVSPEQSLYQDIRYTWQFDPKSSDVFTFSPQDIAAYLAVAGHALKKDKNWTPMEMNPFPLPSRKGYDFAKLLNNNVLIYDPTLKDEPRLRHLHLPEKAILQARLIGVLGHDASVYWDWDRDGKLREYDFAKQGEK